MGKIVGRWGYFTYNDLFGSDEYRNYVDPFRNYSATGESSHPAHVMAFVVYIWHILRSVGADKRRVGVSRGQQACLAFYTQPAEPFKHVKIVTSPGHILYAQGGNYLLLAPLYFSFSCLL